MGCLVRHSGKNEVRELSGILQLWASVLYELFVSCILSAWVCLLCGGRIKIANRTRGGSTLGRGAQAPPNSRHPNCIAGHPNLAVLLTLCGQLMW